MTFDETALFSRWARNVLVGDPNDFVVCVTASGHTSVSGSGKTTLSLYLAKMFNHYLEEKRNGDHVEFDAKEHATVDAHELAYEVVPEMEQTGIVCYDEAQGAPGTSGLDKRRSMQQESVDAINSVLANRDKELTIIVTAQLISMLDKRLLPIIDAWLLITEEPSSPDGPLAVHHDIYVEDYELSSPQLRTPIIEEIQWPRINHNDADYRAMERKKQRAKKRRLEEDDQKAPEDIKKDQKKEVAQRLRNMGHTVNDIADAVGMSNGWVSQNTTAPEEAKA